MFLGRLINAKIIYRNVLDCGTCYDTYADSSYSNKKITTKVYEETYKTLFGIIKTKYKIIQMIPWNKIHRTNGDYQTKKILKDRAYEEKIMALEFIENLFKEV